MPSAKRVAARISGDGARQIPAAGAPDTATSAARNTATRSTITNGTINRNTINTGATGNDESNNNTANMNHPADPLAAATASGSQSFFRDDGLPNDLVPVGKVSVEAPAEIRGPVSGAIRIKVTVDTFLTDLYRENHWYLELKDVDDTEAGKCMKLHLYLFILLYI